jgi:hypothetical protein
LQQPGQPGAGAEEPESWLDAAGASGAEQVADRTDPAADGAGRESEVLQGVQTHGGVGDERSADERRADRSRPSRGEALDASLARVAWARMLPHLEQGHQILVFVHTRKGTVCAARRVLEAAQGSGALALLQPKVLRRPARPSVKSLDTCAEDSLLQMV